MIRRLLWKYLRPYLFSHMLIFAVILTGTGISFYQPLLYKELLDGYINHNLNSSHFLRTLIVLVALMLTISFCNFLRNYLTTIVGARMRIKMRNDIYGKVLEQPGKQSVGQYYSLIMNDVDTVIGIINGGLISIVTDTIILLFAAGFLFYLNIFLASMILIFLPVFYFLYMIFRTKIELLESKQKDQIAAMSECLHKGIRQRQSSILFGRKKFSIKLLFREQKKLTRLLIKRSIVGGIFHQSVGLLTGIIPLTVLAVGGTLVMSGKETLGTIVAFYTYVGRTFQPMARLSQVNMGLHSAKVSAQRILGFLERSEVLKGYIPIYGLKKEIIFQRVTFGYQSDLPVLKDFDLRIQKNQAVALVGRNGVGKSTLVQLLLGFEKPNKGHIYYDGIDLEKLDKKTLYKNIAIVNQEEELIPGTLFENIAYGKPGATLKEVIEVSKSVGLDSFIQTLPYQYHTLVNSNEGIAMSVGQKQRILMARALLRKANIVILDEMTSSLDPISEQIIVDLIGELKGKCTIILIAHRFQSLKYMDVIYVLEQGRIVESGTYNQLLSKNGIFSKMHKNQMENLLIQSCGNPESIGSS